MSSLQQQLAAIAARSTHQLDLKAQRIAHGKSLLFEPKAAASQDFNTIYQICLEGFQELCMLDSRFQRYATTLFSEQSKDEERTQMTEQQNQELDMVIESFLSLVASFILLKPALKAVEWLIRRFRIHEYNSQALVLSFLQYHTTPVFLTMLSILPKEIPGMFRFLSPYISQAQNPPRTAIVAAATNRKNPAFFEAYSRYVLLATEAHHHSSTLLSFWATIAAQTVYSRLDAARSGIEAMERERQEAVFLQILPILRDALVLKHAPELQLACFMIITITANKSNLADKVIDGLMETVANSWTDESIEGGLACLAVLAEERKSTKLPKSVIKRLLKTPQLAKRIRDLADQCRLDSLVLGTILGLLSRLDRHDNPDSIPIITELLGSSLMGPKETTAAIKAVFGLAQDLEQHPDISTNSRAQLAELIPALLESNTVGETANETIEANDLDLDRIEMNLNTIVRPSEPAPPKPEAMDVVEREQEAASVSLLDHLPERLDSIDSFLTPASSSTLTEILPAFLQATASAKSLETFLRLPLLERDACLKRPLFFSFLARVGCGPYPVLARRAALDGLLRALVEIEQESVDLQALLPYVLHALTDQSPKIRQIGAECLVAMERIYASSTKEATVWASSSLYEAAAEHQLATTDASKFLSTILVPSVVESTLDSHRIAVVIEATLNGDSKSAEGADFAKLKSALRSSVFDFLASHAVNTPLLTVRSRLLSILNRVGKVGSSGRSRILIPNIRTWTALSLDALMAVCKNEQISSDQLLNTYMATITSREKEGLALLQEIALGDHGAKNSKLAVAAFERIGAIWPSLRREQRLDLAGLLWALAINQEEESEGSDFRQELAQATLGSIELSSDVLVSILGSLPDASQMPQETSPSKRRRTSHGEMVKLTSHDSTELSHALSQITLALELIDSSDPQTHPELLQGLFYLLGELQQYRVQTGSDLIYLQSLLLGSLSAIIEGLKTSSSATVDRSVIRTDLLVDCIRTTSNPQVQTSALLLISNLAVLVPDLVLHSVMPIFTFISTTLLRQGDDYSAHVIGETVSRVIPPLVTALRKRGQDLVTGAAEILLSFTTAFEHIPYQRRLELFSHLSNTLGPAECLFAIIAMLVDKYPTDRKVRLFAADLIQQFDSATQLRTAVNYLELLEDSLKPRRGISEVVFGMKDRPEDSLDDMRRNLLEALSSLLKQGYQSSTLIDALKESDASNAVSAHHLFSSLVEKAIHLLKSLSPSSDLQSPCRQVLGNILDLLPTPELIDAITTLLGNPDDDIRRYVLRSLENRVDAVKPSDVNSRTAILAFLPQITQLLEQSTNATVKRSVVSCIDRIVEKLGKKDPPAMVSAATAVASDQALGHPDEQLQASSLFCIASVAEAVREDFLPLLPVIVPRSFECLDASITSQNESLHDAAYAVISTVIDHMPYIFSGQYLDQTLKLSHRLAMSSLGESSPESRLHFYQLTARRIGAKELFTSIQQQWYHAVETGYAALFEHASLLSMALERHPKSSVIKNSDVLFQVLLEAFDLRRERQVKQLVHLYTDAQVAKIEHMINDVALVLTMKLNDSVFRPFFLQLVDWASSSLPRTDRDGRSLRSTSLFVFLEAFLDKLKGVVTGYASYVLDMAADILEGSFSETSSSQPLLEAVLRTLTKSFDHDQDDFWQSPSHFSKIMGPLVHQLEVATHTTATTTVIPAISALAAAASSTDHHKELDTAILRLARHDNASVRLRAVLTQQNLTEKLGDEWLSLLPEMLPFISELQEDDDDEVERETQRWIKEIEEVLGENLDDMLQ